MKKALFILLLLLTLIVSFTASAQCTLNRNQWQYIGNNGNVQLYLDKSFMEMDGQILNTGACFYFPAGCSMKHGRSKGEHYHMHHISINTGFFSYALKSIVYSDMYGNQIGDGIYFDDDEISYKPIPRKSLWETFCAVAMHLAGKL